MFGVCSVVRCLSLLRFNHHSAVGDFRLIRQRPPSVVVLIAR